jgi:spore maturation protein SpmA
MLNYIWLGLILCAVVIGGCAGKLSDVTKAGLDMAKVAVLDTAFPLIGIMALWLGVMKLAERAGLVALMARALRPVMRLLFPEVPSEHPAMGSMLMNIAANMLGLGNAATPLGLRAMRDLETLNPSPGTATNAMCTFLAINTASIQLIPVTAIAILAAAKSSNPTAIVGTSIMATFCGAISAVAAAKGLARLPMFRLQTPPSSRTGKVAADHPTEGKALTKEVEALPRLAWWGAVVMTAFFIFFAWLFLKEAFPTAFGGRLTDEAAVKSVFVRVIEVISKLSIPFLLSFFPLYAVLRRVKVYEEFVEGAKEGFDVAIRIIPYLVAILVAIGMFRASGGLDLISGWLTPAMRKVGFPPDLLPMAFMRPLSGSGTLGLFRELVSHAGPDSLIARTAGTIYGSTETTFYVLAVYFGSVGIKRTRHAVLAGLVADFVSIVASVWVCRQVFG